MPRASWLLLCAALSGGCTLIIGDRVHDAGTDAGMDLAFMPRDLAGADLIAPDRPVCELAWSMPIESVAVDGFVDIAAAPGGRFVVAYATSAEVHAAVIDGQYSGAIAVAPTRISSCGAGGCKHVRVTASAPGLAPDASNLSYVGYLDATEDDYRIQPLGPSLAAAKPFHQKCASAREPGIFGMSSFVGALACDVDFFDMGTQANQIFLIDTGSLQIYDTWVGDEVRFAGDGTTTWATSLSADGAIDERVIDIATLRGSAPVSFTVAGGGRRHGLGYAAAGDRRVAVVVEDSTTGSHLAFGALGSAPSPFTVSAEPVDGTAIGSVGIAGSQTHFVVAYRVGALARVRSLSNNVYGPPIDIGAAGPAHPQVAWSPDADWGVAYTDAEHHPSFAVVRCPPAAL